MKTFLKQYLVSWIKFLVMTPVVTFSTLSGFIVKLYTLFAMSLLGKGETFNEAMDDIIDSLHR